MTTYDVTPDDEPLDVTAVGEDDLLVEQLRHALSPDAAVIWDDDDDELDPAFALLRALQTDVSAGLPLDAPILPAGVTPLLPRRRHLSRTATVAAVAAGVLSIGGVAAAAAPGMPLEGVRHTLTNAVATAVHAVTPDAPIGPAVESSASPTASPSSRGDAVSDAARSANAVIQIENNLDRAAKLIADGRYQPAKNQLDAAASKLHYVTDATVKADLQSRLTTLQAQLAAMPTAKPTHGPSDDKGKPADHSGKGNSSNRSGQGPDATHKPTALPTKAGRPSTSDHASDDATTEAVETPSSNKGSGSDDE